MSSQAQLIAVGKYYPSVKDALDYEAGAYSDIYSGTMVNTCPIHCETSGTSRDLADALGIKQHDLGNHWLNWAKVINRTQDLLDFADEHPDYKKQVENILTLAKNRFTFFYRPNM